jgi:hypothetical protein
MQAHGKKLSEKGRQWLEIMAQRRAKELALGDKYLEVIKDRTPVKTGETKKSWTLHIHQNDLKGVRWTISPDGREKIVECLEFGTVPHIIYPKAARAEMGIYGNRSSPSGVLVFEMDGETIFVKHVHHPGTKALGIVRLTKLELEQEAASLTASMHAAIQAVKHR